MLRRALFFSAVLHLAVLLSFRPLAILSEMPGQPGPRVVQAQLVARPAPPVPVLAEAQVPSAVPGKGALPLAAERRARVQPVRAPGAQVGAEDSLVESATASGHLPGGGEPAVAATRDSVNPDAIRQYRLNLAREARQFKRYPPLARARGWQGDVVVVVNTVAGSTMPQVSLSQSSGFGLLDEEALQLVGQAVRRAALPEGLRGHNFALTLPIQYRIDD
jgi:protein TonB